MYRFKKIYVATLFGHTTGGVELTHQLVDHLRTKGADSYIVYMKDNRVSADQTITQEYRCYNIQTTNHIEDNTENLLILPEIFFDQIYNYVNIKIGCWWMSVDNYYSNASLADKLVFKPSLAKWYKVLTRYVKYPERRNRISIKELQKQKSRIYHFYQSSYAQMHLYSKGFDRVIPLSDYINTDFIDCKNAEKKDMVLYNPSKGYKFTKKIINTLPDVKFVPLKNLNRKQLSSLFAAAKLYIDFGHFPGKDRLPREAVTSGCCIISSTEGGAFFYEDLPIDRKYKIKRKSSNLPVIANRIKYILEHYDECCRDFDYYRSQVLNERETFFQQIDSFFFYLTNN